ncbi:MAG TPA: zinc ribbon domain-containing protein [Terriglobales bacterium]|nr:zinc ribbon domain-containing protein [Terriglobales bacterium]
MPDFNANFQYVANDGRITHESDCRVEFDAETFTVSSDSGAPISFDLGDIDAVTRDPGQIRLKLYTGRTVVIRALGTAYERFSRDLLEAYRDRMAECLLVAVLKELSRFNGTFEMGRRETCRACGARTRGTKFCTECGTALKPAKAQSVCPSCGTAVEGKFCPECGKPASSESRVGQGGDVEFRLYESNLAIIPATSQAFQWRLADIDAIHFEANSYEVLLDSGDLSLKVAGLGKRTADFASRVREAVRNVASASARAIRRSFPFLNPDELQAIATILREGRSVPVAKLMAVHSRMQRGVSNVAVDKELEPYYDELTRLSSGELLYAGFKLIRPEEQREAEPDTSLNDEEVSEESILENAEEVEVEEEASSESNTDDLDTLYWFFFPIAKRPGSKELANVVAWEASSRSGRATYFFRIVKPEQAARLASADGRALLESSIRTLNNAFAILNFKRRPIYLSDDDLQGDARFRRYAIAARRIPELREIRALFLGRAIHSSFEAWKTQVSGIIAKAGM